MVRGQIGGFARNGLMYAKRENMKKLHSCRLYIAGLITICIFETGCQKKEMMKDFPEQIKKPFPQAVNYPGCIKPNHVSQSDLNNSVARFYNYWKTTYLKNDLSTLPGGYYVKGEVLGDPEGFNPSGCSEGQGYGMIITVLMAGHDNDARTIFDGLFKTSRVYHSRVNNNLMGWVVSDNYQAQGHFASATDGDMDIAYALILAHYQWGSTGLINYLAEAKKIINEGLKPGNITTGNRLNLGDWDGKDSLNTRPSDWMPDHMKTFYQETHDAAWLQVADNLYTVYDQFIAKYSPSTGLISDFVVNDPPEPASQYFLKEFRETDRYYYNASRVPLRLVIDYGLFGSARAYNVLNKLVPWIITKTGNEPSKIRAGYYLDGTNFGTDTATVFTSSFVAAAVISTANQDFVNRGWDYIKGSNDGYFSDTYALLCMLFISGNWWKPGA